MTSNELKEVAHNAACIYHDVYQWDFFERQMKPDVKRRLFTADPGTYSRVMHAFNILFVLAGFIVFVAIMTG
jgi:hypothetical protein